jgi:hypothetical protein
MIRKYINKERTHWKTPDGRSSGIVDPLSPEERAAILPEDPPIPEPPAKVDPRDERIAALEARLAILEKKVIKS